MESRTLFRALYDNTGSLQDKFVDYWGRVAQKFAKNKYVMGFDPLNEPGVSANTLLEN